MKKITSTASLALRLTWLRVLGLFALVGAAQWLAFSRGFTIDQAVEYQIDELPGTIGRLGAAALMFLLSFAVSDGKNKHTAYTLRRLALSEGTVTVIWALVFAGYMLLYWVFQIGMCLGMYARFAAQVDGVNRLFLAAYRSSWFHYLLPLSEPWGYARNVAIVLGFGSAGAVSARSARNGRSAPLCMALVMLFACLVLMPYEMASQNQDMFMVTAIVICTVIDWNWTRAWMRDEAV